MLLSTLENVVVTPAFQKRDSRPTYKTIILPVVLYGSQLDLILKQEQRLGCSRTNYLGRYLGLRKTKLQENGESYIMLNYMHCILGLT